MRIKISQRCASIVKYPYLSFGFALTFYSGNRAYSKVIAQSAVFKLHSGGRMQYTENDLNSHKGQSSDPGEKALIDKYSTMGLFGHSPKFVEMLHMVEAACRSDVRVLLIGKTGTGKERVAQAIHHFSNRNNGPFVAVDCGAVPEQLMESEFFGHTRGAFTGAGTTREGLFREANGGTLFLDEVNNLPMELQTRLLRVLEENEIRRVGSDNTEKINVRVIAATGTGLEKMILNKKFREDLYFRLHVYPIYIPQLNDRPCDIPLLALHFLRKYSAQQKKKLKDFDRKIDQFIMQRRWNGNVRELEYFVERLVTIAESSRLRIDPDLLPGDLRKEYDEFIGLANDNPCYKSLKEMVDELESRIIREALFTCNWNQSAVARRLGTSEKSIRYKMIKLGIIRENDSGTS
jgi:transcriptional regulator with PAS, ATPase and Fis domain